MPSDDNGRTYLERLGLTDNSVMALSPYLQGYQCREDDTIDVAKGLADNWSLTSLELCRCCVNADGATALAEALHVNHTLRYLGLARNRLGDAGVEHIAAALCENQSLEILDLSSNGVRDHGALALAQMLEIQPEVHEDKKCGELRTLIIENNRIGKSGAAALGAALKQTTKLKALNMAGNRLMEAGAVAISEGIGENTSLTQLNLARNDINPEGGVALANAMRSNRSIATLNLATNRLGESVALFADLSNENTVLKDLSLEACCIDAEAAQEFSKKLLQPSLLSVNLGLNPLKDDGVAAICGGFRGKPVRYFDLSAVGLTPKGISAVCDFINIAPCLQSLQLDGNTLNPEALRELTRVLATNTTIDALNIENTNIGVRGACLLAEALCNNPGFRSLDIADNNIGSEGCVALCGTLARMRRVTEVDFGSNNIASTEAVMQGLCSLFANNSQLVKVKLEDNPVGDPLPGGMLTRGHAEEMCPGGLPAAEPFPLRRAQGQGRAAASALTAQPARAEDPRQQAVRGSPAAGAAGLMNASQTLFRPAWAPAVPPARVFGDEVRRSVEEEDEDEAEDGANPPLVPSKGSLLHPLYPGFGKGRLSNEEHTDTMDVTVPICLAHSIRPSGTEVCTASQSFSEMMFLNPPRRTMKKSPYSLDRLENNVGALPVTEEQLRRKFQELDVDGSGTLDYDEFKVIYSNFQNFGVYQPQAEIEKIMKKYKILEDGRITFDEFCLIMLSLAKR